MAATSELVYVETSLEEGDGVRAYHPDGTVAWEARTSRWTWPSDHSPTQESLAIAPDGGVLWGGRFCSGSEPCEDELAAFSPGGVE